MMGKIKEIFFIIFFFLIGVFFAKIYQNYKINNLKLKEIEKKFKISEFKKRLKKGEIELLEIQDNGFTKTYLKKEENLLFIFFRLDDCPACLDEVKCLIKELKGKNIKILLLTDHPVLKEIMLFKMINFEFSEIYWDKNKKIGDLILSPTPIYLIFKKNYKPVDAGIIAPLKGNKTFCEKFVEKFERSFK
jgi:hypothetical protein